MVAEGGHQVLRHRQAAWKQITSPRWERPEERGLLCKEVPGLAGVRHADCHGRSASGCPCQCFLGSRKDQTLRENQQLLVRGAGPCSKSDLYPAKLSVPTSTAELCIHTGRAAETVSQHATGIQPTKLYFSPPGSFSNFRF